MSKNKVIFILFLLASAYIASAQNLTLSGYVRDKATGETLIGASIYEKADPSVGTATNTYGFFSLTLPTDSVNLNVAYIGYQSEAYLFLLKANQTLNVGIKQSATLREVEIVAEKYERIEERVGR